MEYHVKCHNELFRALASSPAARWPPPCGRERSEQDLAKPESPCRRAPQKGPKMAQNGQNGKNVENFSIFRFCSKCTKMVSKWSKMVPKHIFMPFWPISAVSPLHFGAPEAIWGPKWTQNGPKWSKSRNFSDSVSVKVNSGKKSGTDSS